jgi:hypothetical protein
LVLTDESPTQNRYSGSLPSVKRFEAGFREVWSFCTELRSSHDMRLYILSKVHGLIDETTVLQAYAVPNQFQMDGGEIAKRLKPILDGLGDRDWLLLVLSSQFIDHVFKESNYATLKRCRARLIVVGSRRIADELAAAGVKAEFFNRVGVARIGSENRREILRMLPSGQG